MLLGGVSMIRGVDQLAVGSGGHIKFGRLSGAAKAPLYAETFFM
jgi:hypothetical protein